MGIDTHALNFLRYVTRDRPLGNVITIGRQGLHVIEPVVRDLVAVHPSYTNDPFCEELLINYFGAERVESIDYSSYENATYIHDMNKPLPENLVGKFDTVIDAGSLEHIYNVPQALRNCSLLCVPGGQIVHILPTNNFSGHGFWQFSPELFFTLYSANNGYANTDVFIARIQDTQRWYQVIKPTKGQRVNVISSDQLHVMVRTIRTHATFEHEHIQQSDYVYEWSGISEVGDSVGKSASGIWMLKRSVKSKPLFYKFLVITRNRWGFSFKNRLSDRNPGLSVIRVKKILSKTWQG